MTFSSFLFNVLTALLIEKKKNLNLIYIYIEIDIYNIIKEMPRKNTMRDNVNAVRSRLPYLTNLSREQIELALLYYESNVDETVNAFNRSMKLFQSKFICICIYIF
jgi:hypothetical protein